MIFLDLLIEPIAPVLDFWAFEGENAPLQNYIGWTAVAIFLQSIFHYFRIEVKGGFKSVIYFTDYFLYRIIDKAKHCWYLKFNF